MEHVVLVNEYDQPIGTMEKMEVHQRGLLHRAFSVLLFNSRGELLLQKRARSKYHSGGLWTNTCCSHPFPGEEVTQGARRKLVQEMGIVAKPQPAFSFIYRATFENGLHEHELDHVLTDVFDGEPRLNPDEAEDWRWITMDNLAADIDHAPHLYTAWFKILLRQPAFPLAIPGALA